MSENAYTLERIDSHSVTMDYHTQKEEVFLYFVTTWRGQPAAVTMEANRYVHSSGWSEWRVFPNDAREFTNHQGLGNELTATAKTRLGDQLRPVVAAWLEGEKLRDHLTYAQSRAGAFARMIEHKLREERPYMDNPTRDTRKALAEHGHELEPEQLKRLTRAADAFDEFSSILYERKES